MTTAIKPSLCQGEPFSSASADEWRALHRQHMNVLLEGPETAVEAVVQRLWPRLRQPVMCKQRRAALALPTGEVGALILHEVATLTMHEQTQLLEWLNTASRPPARPPQVVSTSSQPLFPRVGLGLFGEALYYRLNVLRIQIHSSDIRPDEERAFDDAPDRRDTTPILVDTA